MQIENHMLRRMTLEEFADKYGLVMEIHERHHHEGESNRFYAHFKRAEVSEGCLLIGAYGNGATSEDALLEYVSEISGKVLIVNAHAPEREEIVVPILTGVFKPVRSRNGEVVPDRDRRDEMDEPDDADLKRIEEWDYIAQGGLALLEHLRSVWSDYGDVRVKDDDSWEFVTGGWSGNEAMIGALRQNFMAWSQLWESSHRGGLHIFRLPG